MANTYTQCYVHLVFSPRNHKALIHQDWKTGLEKYITGIVQKQGHKMLCINSRPDHIHILIGYNLNHLVPELVKTIKVSSTEWIKTNKLSKYPFYWQLGYGAFTCSRSQRDNLIRYIEQQEEHHRHRTFEEEYKLLLKEHEIDYEEQYLFEFWNDIPNWE